MRETWSPNKLDSWDNGNKSAKRWAMGVTHAGWFKSQQVLLLKATYNIPVLSTSII